MVRGVVLLPFFVFNAEQTKELGQKIQSATQTAYNTLADAARKTERSITRPDQSVKRQRSEA